MREPPAADAGVGPKAAVRLGRFSVLCGGESREEDSPEVRARAAAVRRALAEEIRGQTRGQTPRRGRVRPRTARGA